VAPTRASVDDIATGIRPPSRRTVAKGAAWSLPVIATGIAAPAQAESPGVCVACTTGSRCIITVGDGGTCQCAAGLACVGTGPLGLTNVCVGAQVAGLVVACGSTTCTGVCLSAGGAVITAFNTLMTAMSTFVNGVRLVPGLLGLRTCVNQPGLPTNVCVSPLGDGGLGSMCVQRFTCGSTTVIGTLLATLDSAVTSFVTTLQGLGILTSSSCAAPYVCKDGASVATDFDGVFGIAAFGTSTRVGICQCGPQSTCPDVAGFTVAC